IIWNLAKNLWLRCEESWPVIQFGTILGCILVDFKSEKGKKLHGKNCLFEILVTESAHLIWKLRCEKVIKFERVPDKFHSPDEIHNRWVAQVNRRLHLDILSTNRKLQDRSALTQGIVLQTWSGVQKDEDSLPNNWIWQQGVLVGIPSRHPPGQNR
ncbi:hypothetical protein L208DRAFT_1232612, partial [Tricholoma matsutake]